MFEPINSSEKLKRPHHIVQKNVIRWQFPITLFSIVLGRCKKHLMLNFMYF